MYVKHIIKLLAKERRLSGYEIAAKLPARGSSVWYSLKRLRDVDVITESNELTDLGQRLFELMEATQGWVSREKCVSRFGLDAIETAKKLGITFERPNAIIVKEIKDPSSEEVLADKRESNASQIAVRAFNIARRTARNLPLIADILQRRREIFNERWNLWFLGDIPPPPPPFPLVSPDSAVELMFPERIAEPNDRPICESDRDKTDRREGTSNDEGLNEMRRELHERYESLKEIKRRQGLKEETTSPTSDNANVPNVSSARAALEARTEFNRLIDSLRYGTSMQEMS